MIDVHHHILPARYVQEVGEAFITAQGSSARLPSWSVEGALQGMDAAGIRTAINSISAPGFAPLAAAPAAALARWCNEFAAQVGADHPGRFGFFAALPLPDIDASLREVEHGFDRLGADGVYRQDDAAMTRLRHEAMTRVFFDEDKPVLEAQQRQLGTDDLFDAAPVLMATDAGSARIRRVMRQLREEE